MKNVNEFMEWCNKSWGSVNRSREQLWAKETKQLRNELKYETVSDAIKLRMAEILILESCRYTGSYISSGDDIWYMHNFAKEFTASIYGFKGRSTEPLRAAFFLLAHVDYGRTTPDKRGDYEHICAGGGAMVAMYLLAHLEYLFRVNGRYLNRKGIVIWEIPKQLRTKVSKFKVNSQINNIDQAFALYVYRNKTHLGKCLKKLDQKIGIADRFKRTRNPIMHGEFENPESEAMFYGLMTAMFYYGNKLSIEG